MKNTAAQTQQLKVRIGRKAVTVTSLRQASDVWCAYRDALDLGSSDSPLVTVADASGKTVARISYNGRVWAPDGTEIAL